MFATMSNTVASVGWRKQDDSSSWNSVVKQKKTRTQKPKKVVGYESFNCNRSYAEQQQQAEVDRLSYKRQMIRDQIDAEKNSRINYKKQMIRDQIIQAKDEEIQQAFDEIEMSEHIWEMNMVTHLRNVRDNIDMFTWMGNNNTDKDHQFWYDFMLEYNEQLLVEMEFNSDSGWNDQQMGEYMNARDEEIKSYYDEQDEETLVELGMNQQIKDTEENLEAYVWLENLNTPKEFQFWYDFMINYDYELVLNTEFDSDKGWYNECPHCNWCIHRGMDEDYCRCAKVVNF
jgi:hypothetical protein